MKREIDLEKLTENPFHITRTVTVDKITSDYEYHEYLELYYVISGEMVFHMADQKWKLIEQDCILLEANEIHSVQINENCDYIYLQIPIQVAREMIDSYYCRTFFLNSVKHPEIKKNDHYVKLCHKVMALSNLSEMKPEMYRIMINITYFEILYIISRYYSKYKYQSLEADKNPIYLPRIQKILDMINLNYNKDLSLEYVADSMGLEYHYFSRFFKKYVGVNYKEYVSNMRIERAKVALFTSGESITGVAMECGFGSTKSFMRAFKKRYKMTPSEYRENHMLSNEVVEHKHLE